MIVFNPCIESIPLMPNLREARLRLKPNHGEVMEGRSSVADTTRGSPETSSEVIRRSGLISRVPAGPNRYRYVVLKHHARVPPPPPTLPNQPDDHSASLARQLQRIRAKNKMLLQEQCTWDKNEERWNEHQGVLSKEQSPTGKGNIHQRYPDVQRVADETVTFLRSKTCNPASHVPTTQGVATSNASITGETGRLKGQAMLDFRAENVAKVPHELETACGMSLELSSQTRQTHTMQPIGQDGRPSTIPKPNLAKRTRNQMLLQELAIDRKPSQTRALGTATKMCHTRPMISVTRQPTSQLS